MSQKSQGPRDGKSKPLPDGASTRSRLFYKYSFVLIAVVIIITIIFLATVWLLGNSTQKDIEKTVVEQFGQQQLALAEEIAKLFEKEVGEIQERLEVMSQIPEIRDGDTETCSKKLKELSSQMRVKLGNLGRMGKDGVFYCGAVDSIVGVDGKKYDYLRQIIEDPAHKPVLSRALVFKYADHSKFLAALHVPVFDERGVFEGTLGGAIYFDELQKKYLDDMDFAPGSYAVVYDDDGTTLSHPSPDLISYNVNTDYQYREELAKSPGLKELVKDALAGQTGVRAFSHRGEKMLAAYTPANVFKGRRWSVVVSTPLKGIEGFVAPLISKLQYQLFIVMGIGVLFSSGMVLLLVRWNKVLAHQVKKKTKKVIELNEVLKLLNKILRHDILNDLTVISGQIYLYTKEKGLQEGFKDVLKAIGRCKTLIEQMRKLEAAVAEGKGLKPVDVRRVASEVQQSFPKMKVSVNGEGLVLADEALGTVIANIVRNAEMHAESKRVDIQIEDKGNIVEIAIADYGKGIPDEVKARLFGEGFKYGESGHMGLGLYIVEKTIGRYGGKVYVKDNKPKGTVFVLQLTKTN